MAYARMGEGSDVYIFASIYGSLTCCSCLLAEDDDIHTMYFYSTQSMLDHLEKHLDAGHKVPVRCIARLDAERDKLDAWLTEVNGGRTDGANLGI